MGSDEGGGLHLQRCINWSRLGVALFDLLCSPATLSSPLRSYDPMVLPSGRPSLDLSAPFFLSALFRLSSFSYPVRSPRSSDLSCRRRRRPPPVDSKREQNIKTSKRKSSDKDGFYSDSGNGPLGQISWK